MAQWFVRTAAEEHGPLSSRDLKQMASDGKLSPDDCVRRDDMTKWVRARSVGGLFDALPKSSSPAKTSDARDHDASVQHGAASSSTTAANWYIVRGDTEQGPFERDELKAMVVSGILKSSDTIRKSLSDGSSREWPVAEAFSELFQPSDQGVPPTPGGFVRSIIGVLAGCAFLFMCLCGGLFGPDYDFTGTNSDDAMQLRDEPETFKGSTIRANVNYGGDGMRKIRTDRLFSFEGSIYTRGGRVDVQFDVPEDLEIPNIRPGDYLVVTWDCEEGSLHRGNRVTEIERDN